MALKHLSAVGWLMVVATACTRPAPTPAAAGQELAAVSVTHWTDRTELFAEYPPLVAGRTSRFAIHLTRLDTFEPLREGLVEVHLRGGDRGGEVFRTRGPSRPGIFGVDVTPGGPATRELIVVLRSGGIADEHRLGDTAVYESAEAARAAAPSDAGGGPEGIGFLKEQQWTLEFGTAVVVEQALRGSIRVPAQLVARPGGTAEVAAPVDGRLTRVLDVPLGGSVTRGQELGRLLPPPAVPGDLPQLERARAEAEAALGLAVRDRERAERLTSAGAAPERRLEEARAAEQQARVRLTAAEASLAQYDAARTGGSGTEGLFVVRAPLSGVIANRDAAPGANVTAGTVLFRVVDAADVHVVGHVPEAEALAARSATVAELEIPGREGRLPAGRLAGVGKVLDPESRTLPVTFAFDNRSHRFPVGQAVFLHLLKDSTEPGPVVPASAIVDDAGRPIVFVQVAGETFERRAVTVGARTGDLVQIEEGVSAGERVVTRGAYLVRLASLSTSVPAHGHVH